MRLQGWTDCERKQWPRGLSRPVTPRPHVCQLVLIRRVSYATARDSCVHTHGDEPRRQERLIHNHKCCQIIEVKGFIVMPFFYGFPQSHSDPKTTKYDMSVHLPPDENVTKRCDCFIAGRYEYDTNLRLGREWLMNHAFPRQHLSKDSAMFPNADSPHTYPKIPLSSCFS